MILIKIYNSDVLLLFVDSLSPSLFAFIFN